jgi:hypothetical protein
MSKLLLAALLLSAAMPAQAEPGVPIQPSVDSPQQRQALQGLLSCLAQARPRWARQMLAYPYLSDTQARMAAEALTGRDTCLRGGELEVTFRTSSMVAGLAEHFLRTDLPKVDFGRVQAALATLPAKNGSEDFAFCVASRDPVAARDLTLSEFGSEAEMRAARQLAAGIGPCTVRGEQLTVDLQALRALVAAALYRGVATALESRS